MVKSVVQTRYPSQEMVRYSYTRLVILCPFQINSLQFADFGWSKVGHKFRSSNECTKLKAEAMA